MLHLKHRPADEVRQCARCGQATLICTNRWQHRILGMDTQTWTLDFECRACGARVTLHPQKQISVERLFAYVMIPAIFPSVFFFASARRKARAWTDNPVVAGAAPPIAPRGPRDRVCACGRAARCSAIARKQTLWMALGTRYEYRCSQCSKAFAVHDDRGVVFSFVAASLLSAVGTLVIAFPPGSAVGAEQNNRWFGLALLVIGALAWVSLALRIRARRAHPEIT